MSNLGSRLGRPLDVYAHAIRSAQRKHLVEAVNGWIKHILGFRQFSLRGLNAVQGEWDLVCLSLNLRRMSSLMRLT